MVTKEPGEQEVAKSGWLVGDSEAERREGQCGCHRVR